MPESCQWEGSQAAVLPVNHSALTLPVAHPPARNPTWAGMPAALKWKKPNTRGYSFSWIFNQFGTFCTCRWQLLKCNLTKIQEADSQMCKTTVTGLHEGENDPNYLKTFRYALSLD